MPRKGLGQKKSVGGEDKDEGSGGNEAREKTNAGSTEKIRARGRGKGLGRKGIVMRRGRRIVGKAKKVTSKKSASKAGGRRIARKAGDRRIVRKAGDRKIAREVREKKPGGKKIRSLSAARDDGLQGLASGSQRSTYRPSRRPNKKRITLFMDADVLAWFKEGGQGYQKEINRALRRVMGEERGKEQG